VIYLAPTRALAQQKCEEWSLKFGPLGHSCVELTGDTGALDLPALVSASILVTTPEKWDSVTRRLHDRISLVSTAGLLLIDEVHLLAEARGACLEAVVSRMKTLAARSPAEHPSSRMRIVAASATMGDPRDIAAWIGAPEGSVFSFGQAYRPVQLQLTVIGYRQAGNPFQFTSFLDYHLADVISRYAEGLPALVFVPTRRDTVTSATKLARRAGGGRERGRDRGGGGCVLRGSGGGCVRWGANFLGGNFFYCEVNKTALPPNPYFFLIHMCD
jgi:ATP-dependent DNA helicase HFM1/MER3